MVAKSPKLGIALICVLIAQSFLNKLEIKEYIPLLDFWDELVVLSMSYGAMIAFSKLMTDPKGKILISLLFIYWGVQFVSTLMGDGGFLQALYQFVLDAKYPIVLFYCIWIYRVGESEHLFGKLLCFILLLNIPFIFLQLFFPGVYDSIFSRGEHRGVFAFIGGGGVSRAAGIFWHPGILAIFSVAAVSYFYTKISSSSATNMDRLFLWISSITLLLTFSRGEIGGIVVGLIIVRLFVYSSASIRPLFIMLSIAMLAISVFAYETYFSRALAEMGITNEYASLAPRAAFMNAGLEIAEDYAPFGAGLGTFGGAAAVAFDSDLFYKYLIAYEWYFDHGLYLTDTYWPKVIAESGFIGGFFNLLFLMTPAVFSYSSARAGRVRAGEIAQAYSLVMIVFMIVDSLSAPIYGSVLACICSSFLLGSTFLVEKSDDLRT